MPTKSPDSYLEFFYKEMDRAYSSCDLIKLKNFIQKFKEVQSWMIASDYCIGDKHKKNDTIAISIIPYLIELTDMKRQINSIAANDIKGTKKISDEFLEYIGSGNSYHACVITLDHSALGKTKEDVDRIVDDYVSQLRECCKLNDQNAEVYNQTISKLLQLRQRNQNKSFRRVMFQNMMFVTSMISFYCYFIHKNASVQKICWFSDRDALIDMGRGLAFDIVNLTTHQLCLSNGLDNTKLQLLFGSPEREGKTWFEEVVRIPDYIAGTFADWDIEKNECKDKYIPIIEKLVAGNDNFILSKIGLQEKIVEHKLVLVSSKFKN